MLKKIWLKNEKNSIVFIKRIHDMTTCELIWFNDKNEKITDQCLIKSLDKSSLNDEIIFENQSYKVASISH